MSTVGGKHKLVGFVDLGKGHELMNILSGLFLCTLKTSK